jgi:hypothetical protein
MKSDDEDDEDMGYNSDEDTSPESPGLCEITPDMSEESEELDGKMEEEESSWEDTDFEMKMGMCDTYWANLQITTSRTPLTSTLRRSRPLQNTPVLSMKIALRICLRHTSPLHRPLCPNRCFYRCIQMNVTAKFSSTVM